VFARAFFLFKIWIRIIYCSNTLSIHTIEAIRAISGITTGTFSFSFESLDEQRPVMPATDALIITPKTDGAMLVIKSGHTDRKIIQIVLDKFEKAGQPIIGTVLNRVDMKKEGYYRYYKKYYSSYYGK